MKRAWERRRLIQAGARFIVEQDARGIEYIEFDLWRDHAGNYRAEAVPG